MAGGFATPRGMKLRNHIAPIAILLVSCVCVSAQVVVSGSSGADGNYPNLKGAFDMGADEYAP